jgi:hypothetical protein
VVRFIVRERDCYVVVCRNRQKQCTKRCWACGLTVGLECVSIINQSKLLACSVLMAWSLISVILVVRAATNAENERKRGD